MIGTIYPPGAKLILFFATRFSSSFVPLKLSRQIKSDLILIVVVLIWGANFPILKQVLEVIHPFVLNVLRFMVSITSIGVILFFFRKVRTPLSISNFRQHAHVLIPVGLLGYFLYQFFFILGIESTTAGNSALLMASTPAWTAIIGVLFTREPMSIKAWTGLFVSLFGTVIIVIAGSGVISMNSDYFWGNALILVAAICWGSYTALSKSATKNLDALSFTLLGLLLSFPLNVAISIPFIKDVAWGDVTIGAWMAIIYSGGLSTGIAVVLWTYTVKEAGATYTAVFGNLVPVVALIGSYLLLHEIINGAQLIGGIFILSGLFLMRYDRIKKIN